MNVDVFIAARKAKGISQIELAEGVCTQATLSRFESMNQIPSLKILLALCKKLDLSLADLFPKVSMQASQNSKIMDEAEFYFITSEYDKSHELIQSVISEQLESDEMLARYHYLKGFLMIFRNAPLGDVLFNFDQILFKQDKALEIYNLLSYAGIGMVHAREKDLEKAEFYFNKVLEQIYAYPISDNYDTWRVLNIVFHSGEFYSQHQEFELGNALLEYVVTICQDNHVTYYLARAMYQLTLNAISQNKERSVIKEMIADTKAYAKINRNAIKLKLLSSLEEEYL